jgi:transcriptional regulator with XRE-family HTH domain
MNYFSENTPNSVQLALKEKIKLIRKNQKISQEELAHRSGVSFGSVKRFETTGQISMESFLKLLHVLDRLDEMGRILNSNENLSQIEKLFGNKTRK